MQASARQEADWIAAKLGDNGIPTLRLSGVNEPGFQNWDH